MSVEYWNACVAVTQMGGHGNFSDPRLGIDIVQAPDLVTPKLPALRDYQHSLAAPAFAGAVDRAASLRGRALFSRIPHAWMAARRSRRTGTTAAFICGRILFRLSAGSVRSDDH